MAIEVNRRYRSVLSNLPNIRSLLTGVAELCLD